MPSKQMNPSTYKQVVENMNALSNVISELEGDSGIITRLDNAESNITTLNDSVTTISDNIQSISEDLGTVEDKVSTLDSTVKSLDETVKEAIVDPPPGGGLEQDEDGVTKIIGIHVVTKDADVDNTIDKYTQGVTYEFKKISAIGLSGKPGMSGEYCAVMTVKKDGALSGETGDIIVTEFQIAYGTDKVCFYRREAIKRGDDYSWGEWATQEEPRKQFVESETEPTDQQPGEYWFEPVIIPDPYIPPSPYPDPLPEPEVT